MLQKFLDFIAWASASGPNLIASVVAVLSALIALFLLIPGEQPEKLLQGIVDFLKKFSSKPEEKK